MRRLIVVGVALLPLLAGCWGERRKPIPEHVITITNDPGRYLYDGQPMAFDQVQDELVSLGEHNRRRVTGTARAIVTIAAEPGVPWERINEAAEWCARAGVDNVIPTGR